MTCSGHWHRLHNTYIDELPGAVVARNGDGEDTLDLAAEHVDGASGGKAARHCLRQVDRHKTKPRYAQKQL